MHAYGAAVSCMYALTCTCVHDDNLSWEIHSAGREYTRAVNWHRSICWTCWDYFLFKRAEVWFYASAGRVLHTWSVWSWNCWVLEFFLGLPRPIRIQLLSKSLKAHGSVNDATIVSLAIVGSSSDKKHLVHWMVNLCVEWNWFDRYAYTRSKRELEEAYTRSPRTTSRSWPKQHGSTNESSKRAAKCQLDRFVVPAESDKMNN